MILVPMQRNPRWGIVREETERDEVIDKFVMLIVCGLLSITLILILTINVW